MSRNRLILCSTVLLLVVSLACSVSFNTGGEEEDQPTSAEMTLAAIYDNYTS
jgi:hypothetical protein